PAPGGLLYWHVLELLRGLAAKCRIVGFDLVEFMPSRDTTGLSALTAARLVWNAVAAIAAARKRGGLRRCGAQPIEEQHEEAFGVDDVRHAAVRSAGRAPGLPALAHDDPRRLPLRQARVDGKTHRQRIVQVHVTPETERLLRARRDDGGERAGAAGQRGVEPVAIDRGLARGVQRYEVNS